MPQRSGLQGPLLQPSEDHDAEVLLDLTIAGATPVSTCRAIFGCAGRGGSPRTDEMVAASTCSSGHTGLLAEFLGRLAPDSGCSASPWEDEDDGNGSSNSRSTNSSSASVLFSQRRRLCYSTPLGLPQRLLLGPLGGPAAVRNTEEQHLRQQLQVLPIETAAGAAVSSTAGIVVTSRCRSTGVPFADCFANHLEWKLVEVVPPAVCGAAARPGFGLASLRSADAADGRGGGGGTRVVITASCRFHTRLPSAAAALQGLIRKESLEVSEGSAVHSRLRSMMLPPTDVSPGWYCRACGVCILHLPHTWSNWSLIPLRPLL